MCGCDSNTTADRAYKHIVHKNNILGARKRGRPPIPSSRWRCLRHRTQHPERRDGVPSYIDDDAHQGWLVHRVSGGRLRRVLISTTFPSNPRRTSGSPNRNTYAAGTPAHHELLPPCPARAHKRPPKRDTPHRACPFTCSSVHRVRVCAKSRST